MNRTFAASASFFLLFLFFIAIIVASPIASAATWVEAVDGELSGTGSNPTSLTFDLGVNIVQGTMGAPFGGDLDPDIFKVTIQPGQQLVSIVVNSITPGQNSFYAISVGSTINMFSGGSHLSNFLIGTPGEYFDKLSSPEFGGAGHEGPLGAGTYTFWFQELQLQRDYTMTYTLVPEPSTAALLGLAAFAAARRRAGGPRRGNA